MVNHMENIKSVGDIHEYEYNNNNDNLDEFNKNILNILKLIYNCIPLSLKNKISFQNKPSSMTLNSTWVKQDRMSNNIKFPGVTFKLFGSHFTTDLGEGLCGWSNHGYTYTEANQFNKNVLESNFAVRKEKKTYNSSNNTYYTDYFWHVKDNIIKPIQGFYKSTQIRDSWNKVCLLNNIIDGPTFKDYLETK